MYNTELIDLNDYDLPKHFTIQQKYFIICKAYPVDKKRVAKIKTERLQEDAAEVNDDDAEAVAEMEQDYENQPEVEEPDQNFKPELEVDEIEVDEGGYCP